VANILVIHSGLRGISNASLEMANRLHHAGHYTFMASMLNDDQLSPNNHFTSVDIKPILFDYKLQRKVDQNVPLNRASFYEQIYSNLEFDKFHNLLKSKSIDLVLIDIELHEYIIYLYSKQIPFILISQWFSIWKSKGNLPPSSKKVPSKPFDHEFLWFINKWKRVINLSIKSVQTKGKNRRDFIRYLADKLDFNSSYFVSNQFPLPFSYKKFSVVSTTHPDLEFTQNSLENLHYVFPMVCETRQEIQNIKFEKDFVEILIRIKKENKKLIVVTKSSMKGDKASNINSILSASQGIQDCIFIFSLGASFIDFQQHQSDSIYIYKSIPQLVALKFASLSINHGGIHTINECIHFKIPMLILSGGKFDQNGCAARIANYGCGISYFSENIDTNKLKNSISKLLNDESYTEKINQLHDSYTKAKQDQIFKKFIDEQLKINSIN